MRKVFLAPHHDDECLFGAFTLLREKPTVAVVFDGGPEREAETDAACRILGCEVEHWRLPVDASVDQVAARIPDAGLFFVPLWEDDGQPQHNTVASAAYGLPVTRYATYTPEGKTVTDREVEFEPAWIGLKLQALACYGSQFHSPGRSAHFLRDQSEFYAGGLDG